MFYSIIINDHDLLFTLVSVCITVILLISIIIIVSFSKYQQMVKINKWEVFINQIITDTIIYNNINNLNKSDFESLLKNKRFRNLFVEKMIETEKKFSGIIHNTIHNFYYSNHLNNDSLLKLQSKNPYIIAKGIQQLTAMGVRDALPKIKPYLNHKNKVVYQEAQCSMIFFNGFNGLLFLNNFHLVLSNWQQLRLLRSITEIPLKNYSLIKQWLLSENPSVIIFTLRLVAKFQIISLYPQVIELLLHTNTKIQIEVLRTLQILENDKTLIDVTKVFEEKNTEIQLEIIYLIKSLNDKQSKLFLKNQLFEHPSSIVKIAIAEVLLFFGEQEFLKNILRNTTDNNEFKQIINHVLQEKI